MDERRPDTPAANPSRPATLSPLQRAWRDYQRHTANCAQCRTKAGGRCEEALDLLRAHRDECDAAYRRLTDEVPRPVPPRQ